MYTTYFLYQYPKQIPESIKISDVIYQRVNFETLKTIIKNNNINLNKIKFFIGYSGQGDGQIKTGLNENSWLIIYATPKFVFNTQHDKIWKNRLNELRGEYKLMIKFTIDSQLN